MTNREVASTSFHGNVITFKKITICVWFVCVCVCVCSGLWCVCVCILQRRVFESVNVIYSISLRTYIWFALISFLLLSVYPFLAGRRNTFDHVLKLVCYSIEILLRHYFFTYIPYIFRFWFGFFYVYTYIHSWNEWVKIIVDKKCKLGSGILLLLFLFFLRIIVTWKNNMLFDCSRCLTKCSQCLCGFIWNS